MSSTPHAPVLRVLTAALAVTAGTTLAVRLSSHAGPAAQPGQGVAAVAQAPSPVESAAAWLSANLPHATTLIADDPARAALIGSGFPAAIVRKPSEVTRCADISFIVITDPVAANAAQSGCGRSGLPVAMFGSGTRAVRVDEISPAGARALAAQRALDARERKLAGAALTRNPSVHASAATRAQLSSGALDLRAATVIAVLAAHTTVHVRAITGVPAETSAGLPARSVEAVLADPTALSTVLADVAEAFRPSPTARTSTESLYLTWPFRVEPVPTVH